MYLDYRIHIIDDDFGDRNTGHEVEELKSKLEKTIEDKGLQPIVCVFTNIGDAKNNLSTRIDYFLSDENLSDTDSGADFYHELRNTYRDAFCDFLLYTRNDKRQIVEKQIDELTSKQDPNLFSRFSFVARGDDASWINHVIEIVEHSLSRREQMNTLRAIFAHETSKIDSVLKEYFAKTEPKALRDNFAETIYRISDVDLVNDLHVVRYLRNGLVHNNEVTDANGNTHIPYRDATGEKKFDLSQAPSALNMLKTAKADLLSKLGLIVD
jgi:hypothetical protein